jgi:hypothetical protein
MALVLQSFSSAISLPILLISILLFLIPYAWAATILFPITTLLASRQKVDYWFLIKRSLIHMWPTALQVLIYSAYIVAAQLIYLWLLFQQVRTSQGLMTSIALPLLTIAFVVLTTFTSTPFVLAICHAAHGERKPLSTVLLGLNQGYWAAAGWRFAGMIVLDGFLYFVLAMVGVLLSGISGSPIFSLVFSLLGLWVFFSITATTSYLWRRYVVTA